MSNPNLKMAQIPKYDRYKSVLSFILSERLLTITVLGSIFTFQFIASLKQYIINPLLDFVLPEENFSFMNLVIRDGVSFPKPEPKKLVVDFGSFFKEFFIWIFMITILFLMAKYTRFPDDIGGNPGVSIM
jgi:large-conductance mechanosensitive channel